MSQNIISIELRSAEYNIFVEFEIIKTFAPSILHLILQISLLEWHIQKSSIAYLITEKVSFPGKIYSRKLILKCLSIIFIGIFWYRICMTRICGHFSNYWTPETFKK